MSVLHENSDVSLLAVFWGISAIFFFAAVFICAVIVVRRYVRNRHFLKRQRRKDRYHDFIMKALKGEIDPEETPLTCDIRDMAEVLLHYFRTLKGVKHHKLQSLISRNESEGRLIEATRDGISGTRMSAMKVLSYIDTQESLNAIHAGLTSDNKYIRLTAARSLARRKAFMFLDDIYESLEEAFWNAPQILADILARLGDKAVPFLENVVKSHRSDYQVIASLRALKLLMPPDTRLDIDQLINSDNPQIISAALALSTVSRYQTDIDALALGLESESTHVKINAAKLAVEVRRSDLVPQLYKLSNDPLNWVQYWALKAIWNTGNSGRQFIENLARENKMAADVALEIKSGYV